MSAPLLAVAAVAALAAGCEAADADGGTVSRDARIVERTITTSALAGNGDNWYTDTDGAMGYGGLGGEYLLVPIPLAVGDRIRIVSFAFGGNGSVDLDAYVYALDGAMTRTQIGAASVDNQPPAWTVHAIDVVDTVVTAGGVFVAFVTDQLDGRVGSITATVDGATAVGL